MELEGQQDVCDYYTCNEDDMRLTHPLNWKHLLSNKLAKSTSFIDIPPTVLSYIRDDRIILPSNVATSSTSDNNSNNYDHLLSQPATVIHEVSTSVDAQNQSGGTGTFGNHGSREPVRELDRISQSERANDDTIVASNSPQRSFRVSPEWEESSRLNGDDSSDDEGAPDCEEKAESEEIRQFTALLERHLKMYGGSVVPKINWKAPKDAQWIAFNRSLRCHTAGDIYILLKSSATIQTMLENPFEGFRMTYDEQFLPKNILVLRSWNVQYLSELEFRCFVCDRKLTLICQRELSQGFTRIHEEKDRIISDIHHFYASFIVDFKRLELKFYVLDVIWEPTRKVSIIDINPFGLMTTPTLTSYRELKMLMVETQQVAEAGGSELIDDSKKYGEPYFRYLKCGDQRMVHSETKSPPISSDIVTYFMENSK